MQLGTYRARSSRRAAPVLSQVWIGVVAALASTGCYEDVLSAYGPHPCDACRECEVCVIRDGHGVCTAVPDASTACAEDGFIRRFDSCGEPGEVAVSCGEAHIGCTQTDAGEPLCECRNHWEGVGCTTCPEPWDGAKDCNECRLPWVGEDCDECPEGLDPDDQCQSCLPGYREPNCEPCLDPEVCDGLDNDCDGEVDGELAQASCDDNYTCESGSCECSPEYECNDVCVPTTAYLTDDANCGSCGNACELGTVCEEGSCFNVDECQQDADYCGDHSSCSISGDALLPSCTCESGYASLDGADCGVAVRAVAAGWGHVCVLLESGAVKCWGNNGSGQLGLGYTEHLGDMMGELGDSLPAIDLGMASPVVALDAGAYHTCALFQNGSVKCWGYNWSGQLGLGDEEARGDGRNEMGTDLPVVNLGTGRTAVAISAGASHTCAILDQGAVKCWGYDINGALGIGGASGSARGDQPNEMGDALPVVDLGTGRKAVAISVGAGHTCAKLDDGTVKCWGGNDYGQLGLGNTLHRGDGANEMGDALPALDLGSGTVHGVYAGASHSCVIVGTQVKCWGYGLEGALGDGSANNRGDGPNEMGTALVSVALGQAAAGLALGRHSCALLQDATVKCWGANGTGQLGLGHVNTIGDAASEVDALSGVMLGTTLPAIAVSAGYSMSCAILGDGVLKCWGGNDFGTLGLGDVQHRGDDAGEMGGALPVVRVTGK